MMVTAVICTDYVCTGYVCQLVVRMLFWVSCLGVGTLGGPDWHSGCCVTGENDHLRMGLGGRIGNGLHLRVLWLLGSAVGVDLVWFPE